jgi:ribosomal protein L20
MLANGDIDRARQFQTWIRGEDVQRGMRSWAGLIRSAQAGDADGVLRFARQAYNNQGYSADGVSVTDGRVLRDGGNVTGMELTFRNSDGSERTERFNGTMDLYRRAISFLAPEQQFQFFTGELTAARAAVTGLATEQRREGLIEAREVRGENRTARRDDRQNAVADRRQGQQEQAQAERDVRQSWLRQLEAAARDRGETLPQAQTRLQSIENSNAANDPNWSRKSPEERSRIVLDQYRRNNRDAATVVQPNGAQARAGGVTVYRPPPQGQGLPAR